MRRIRLVVVLIGILVAAPSANADEEMKEKCKELLGQMAESRKARNADALISALEELVSIHNSTEDKGTKGKLQKEIGTILKNKKLGAVHLSAVEAAVGLDDPEGAFKQLKGRMPTPKTEEASTIEIGVLGAVGKMAPLGAISALEKLAEKAKDQNAGAAAIEALGGYKEAKKKRGGIVESLVKLVARFMPPSGQVAGEATRKRWEKLGGPLIVSLNKLTGQKIEDPVKWIEFHRKAKKSPKDLFIDD